MAGNPIIKAVALVLSVLDELGIRYYAGGSVASSVHGVPRYTQDIDLVADLRVEQVDLLAAKLSGDFYADADQMREAIRHGRAFNLIHFTTGFKIDIFSLKKGIFQAGAMDRSEKRAWELDPEGGIELPVASPEDTILEKLMWYRQGGQLSDRQWNDVLGIVTTRPLDLEYLREWAPKLGVADLLDRLFAESSQIHLL
jgi:hypothetical protein